MVFPSDSQVFLPFFHSQGEVICNGTVVALTVLWNEKLPLACLELVDMCILTLAVKMEGNEQVHIECMYWSFDMTSSSFLSFYSRQFWKHCLYSFGQAFCLVVSSYNYQQLLTTLNSLKQPIISTPYYNITITPIFFS